MAAPTEASELQLLGRVEMKLALAEKPEEMTQTLSIFLCPVLMKLASKHAATRNKVIELLRHISKRLNGNNGVLLPLEGLLGLMASSPVAVQNFSIIYLEMAFLRESHINRIKALPQLLKGLAKRPSKHQDKILEMFVEAIEEEMKLPHGVAFEDGGAYFAVRGTDAEEERKEFFSPVLKSATDVRDLLSYCRDLLMCPFSAICPPSSSSSSASLPANLMASLGSSQEGSGAQAGEGEEEEEQQEEQQEGQQEGQQETPVDEIPPGLSENALARVRGKRPLKRSEQSHARKASIIRFLAGGLFSNNDILPHLLIASCDRHHTVQQAAEDAMKRSKFDREDKKLIARLFVLFTGTMEVKSQAVEDRRRGAGPFVRTKILEQFSKSIFAANYFPPAASVISTAVFTRSSPNPKLQNAGLMFMQWCFRHSSDKVMEKLADIVMNGLLRTLDATGKREEADLVLRGSAYRAIGLLGCRTPRVITLPVLKRLFAAIKDEDQSVSTHLQDALAMVCSHFSVTRKGEEVDEDLLALLHAHVKSNVPNHAKRLAVRYAYRCFPFNHAPSRMLCLYLASDQYGQVKEEANKGLNPYALDKGESIPDPDASYPAFPELLKLFDDLLNQKYYSLPPPNLKVIENCLTFLRQTIQSNSSKKNTSSSPCSPLSYLTSLPSTTLSDYYNILKQCLQRVEEARISSLEFVITRALLELTNVPTLPSEHIVDLAQDARVRDFPFSGSRPDLQEVSAKLVAILSPKMEKKVLDELIEKGMGVLEDPQKKNPKEVVGGVLVLGFTLGFALGQKFGGKDADGDVEMDGGDTFSSEMVEKCVAGFFGIVEKHKNNSVVAVAIQALGNVGRFTSSTTDSSKSSKIVEVLTHLLAESSDSKIKEQAAIALGCLCLGRDGELRKVVAKGLMGVCKSRQIEVQFSVGEALACVGAGWGSLSAVDPLVPELFRGEENEKKRLEKEEGEKGKGKEGKEESGSEDDKEVLILILKEIFQLMGHNMSVVRQSALVWLLALTKFCGGHPVMRAHSPQIQQVFCELLGDSDDLMQELAGRGLLFLQQHSEGDEKERLLADLFDQLSGKGKKRSNIPAEDALLLPGNIKLSSASTASKGTYKELCNLASECGQPDLIYSLMAMTSKHAVWNSRKGAAFAVGEMLGKGLAKEEIKKHLKGVIPKMYRHSYDPNPRLAQGMGHILALAYPTQGSTSIVDENLDGIFEECLTAMGSREWRTRQGGCAALAAAIPGRRPHEVMAYIERMWQMCFRCVDDVKESVAQTGIGATKGLASLCVRLSDTTQTPAPQCNDAALLTIDYLSSKGMENEASAVRQFSIGFLVKVMKVSSSEVIEKKCPGLVSILLEGLSTHEVGGEQLNYLSQHSESMQRSKEEIDNLRVSFSKDSPLQEALSICVKHVNQDNVKELAPLLVAVLKRGVGLQTRVGASTFVTQMGIICPNELEVISGRILLALPSLFEDISSAVRSAAIDAAAHVARVGSTKAVDRYVDYLIEKYMEKGLEKSEARVTGSLGLRQLVKLSKEKAANRLDLDKAVGAVFLGLCDSNKSVQHNMEEVWEEMFGAHGGARVFFKNILDAILPSLESSSWPRRAQGAKALSLLASKGGEGMRETPAVVITPLIKALGGRTWDGKITLLTALVDITLYIWKREKGSDKELEELGGKILFLLQKDVKNRKGEYKRQCVMAMKKVVGVVGGGGEEAFGSVSESLLKVLECKGKSEDDDDDDDKSKVPRTLVLCAETWKAFGAAWPSSSASSSSSSSSSPSPAKARFWELFFEQYEQNVWNVQQAMLEAAREIIQKDKGNNDGSFLLRLFRVVFNVETMGKYEAVFSSSCLLLETVVSLLQEEEKREVLQLVRDVEGEVKNGKVRGFLERVKKRLGGSPPVKRKKME